MLPGKEFWLSWSVWIWASLRLLGEHLAWLFFFAFRCFLVVLLVSETGFLLANRKLDFNALKSNETIGQQTEFWRDKVRLWMLWSNPLVPELSTITLIGYQCLFVLIFFFQTLERIATKMHRNSPGGLTSYLENPVKGDRDINKILESIINEMLTSNVNFSAKLARIKMKHKMSRRARSEGGAPPPQSTSSTVAAESPGSLSSANKSSQDALVGGLRDSASDSSRMVKFYSRMKFKLHTSHSSEDLEWAERGPKSLHSTLGNLGVSVANDQQQLLSSDLEMLALSREHFYLSSLLRDKSLIWPVNRTKEWLDFVKIFWSFFYMVVFVVMLTVFIGNTIFIFIATRIHKERTGIFVPENRFRPWGAFFVIMFFNRGTAGFVGPVTLTLTCLLDLSLMNRQLRRMICLFRTRASQLSVLRLYTGRTATNTDMNGKNHEQPGEYELEQLREQCEQISARAYITYRYMLLQNRFLRGVVNGITSGIVGTMGSIWLFTIVLNGPVQQQEYAPVACLTVSCTIGFHLAAILNALFQVYMTKTMDMFWSITYCALHQVEPAASNQESRTNSLELHSQNSIISAHLLFLWNRLMTSDQLRLNFQVTALGILPFDYAGILRFDFWLLSILMLSSVYKNQA